MYTDKLEADQI